MYDILSKSRTESAKWVSFGMRPKGMRVNDIAHEARRVLHEDADACALHAFRGELDGFANDEILRRLRKLDVRHALAALSDEAIVAGWYDVYGSRVSALLLRMIG